MRANDPITRFRAYLEIKGLWNDDAESKASKSVTQLVKDAASNAEKIVHPDVRSLFDDVYTEQTWNLKKEVEELVDEIGET
jgi:2-oxoisovalerate dehydrogenase E1 component alpha subunit